MSQNKPSNAGSTPEGRAYFESQRAALMGEIGVSLEHTLSAINKLNRSLEGVIAVGNEFGSVEALWSTFETVMGQDPNVNAAAAAPADEEGDTTMGDRREEERREQRSQERQGWKSESENDGRGR